MNYSSDPSEGEIYLWSELYNLKNEFPWSVYAKEV